MVGFNQQEAKAMATLFEKFAAMHDTFGELIKLRSDIETFAIEQATDEIPSDQVFCELIDGEFMLAIPVTADFSGPLVGTLIVRYGADGGIIDTHCGDWTPATRG